jgi:hypothetical protein
VLLWSILSGIESAHAADATGPDRYESPAVVVTVVDAESRRPLAGVNVGAQWILEDGVSKPPVRILTAMESVTDAMGMARFPAWGPIPRPPGSAILLGKAPQFLLFKPGYYLRIAGTGPEAQGRVIAKSHWTEEPITMGAVSAESEEMMGLVAASALLQLDVFQPAGCSAVKMPRLMAALHRRARDLGLRERTPFSLDALDAAGHPAECGSLKAAIERALE